MRTATVGKILGALGLVALLSSPYTYFLSSGSPWTSGIKAAVGLALILVFVATNVGQLGQVASRKSSFFFATTAALCLAVLGALVAVNYIAAKKDKRWDLTRNKIFTLSPQTLTVLQGLSQPVHVIGFLTPSNPDYDAADALLKRYQAEAKGKLDVTFKDPRRTPDLAQKYALHEGQSTLVLTRGEGAGESHTAINLLPNQPLSEQDLTNALAQLSAAGEHKVYFLQGHGEWPLEPGGEDGQSVSELVKSLSQEGYTAAPLNLVAAKTVEVPKDAALVVVAGARTRVSAPEEKALREYLDQGGRMAVFEEGEVDGGLQGLLAAYGVEVDPGLLADDHAAVGSPYVILTNFYSEHELARSLKRLQLIAQLPTVRGLTVLHTGLLEGVHVEPVLTTSPYAWEETHPTEEPSRADGQKAGSIPVVTASTRPIPESKARRFEEARLVVFGDSELLADANWGLESNRNLVMNAVAWATNQTTKITIRPPDRDLSTLDMDLGTLQRIRFVSTDLLPFTLLGLGLAIWLNRRNQ